MATYRATIDETGCKSPANKDDSRRFNRIRLEAETLDDLWTQILDHYGMKSRPRIHDGNSVFINTKDGTKRVGFLRSFWNRDYCHDGKAWWQTDWVTFDTVSRELVEV